MNPSVEIWDGKSCMVQKNLDQMIHDGADMKLVFDMHLVTEQEVKELTLRIVQNNTILASKEFTVGQPDVRLRAAKNRTEEKEYLSVVIENNGFAGVAGKLLLVNHEDPSYIYAWKNIGEIDGGLCCKALKDKGKAVYRGNGAAEGYRRFGEGDMENQ